MFPVNVLDVPALKYILALTLPALLISGRIGSLFRASARTRKIPPTNERVLILGASSGIGRALAHRYAARGARMCIVARREVELRTVAAECDNLLPSAQTDSGHRTLCVAADFTNVDDVLKVRETVVSDLGGLDTLIVCAGVSALRPLMEVAGLERKGYLFEPSQANAEGIQHTVKVATAASTVNYIGPLVSAVTFIPLLQQSSPSPSILLISSLAALIPPPTRSIYASTKAASLMLYQVLSIEHPAIAFSLAIPATVQGDFRGSAVDSGPIREVDPAKHGLKPEDVARRCIDAVDAGDKYAFMPAMYGRGGHLTYWLFPSFVEWRARAKYNFTA